MDQNITTLLATAIGGVLSILGGIAANLYLQIVNKKGKDEENHKRVIEEIFSETQKIVQSASEIELVLNAYRASIHLTLDRSKMAELASKREMEYMNIVKLMNISISRIDLLVSLYLPSLKAAFNDYSRKIGDIMQNSSEDTKFDYMSAIKAKEHFQAHLIEILKRKGYNSL